MTFDLSVEERLWRSQKKILSCIHSLQPLSVEPVAIYTCRAVPLGPGGGGVSSGEFPVGMSPGEGGVMVVVVGGIVRLDPNPSALPAARP